MKKFDGERIGKGERLIGGCGELMKRRGGRNGHVCVCLLVMDVNGYGCVRKGYL